MAPKPRAQKNATTGKNASPTVKNSQKSLMPPPPDPPVPQGILEPEVNALSTCLKSAAVKTGQIYSFYVDTRRLGIQNHAPKPPHSLVASLGREIERFDQIIDTMESHLLRAIATLQRDLRREETRINLAEEAAAAIEKQSKPDSPSKSNEVPPPLVTEPEEATQPVQTPTSSPPVSVTGPGRRPSAVSISSLHRPAFPLKLDLSSAALRMPTEEPSIFPSGLASPVTLAPKSARAVGPNEFPDLMAAFTSSSQTIDLTLAPDDSDTMQNVGNTADKPIELDLDGMDIDMAMTDLFGDPTDTASNKAADSTMDGLFSPIVGDSDTSRGTNPAETTKEAPFVNVLPQGSSENDIFTALNATSNSEQEASKDGPSTTRAAPSPASLLANFESASQLQAIESTATTNNITSSETPFDISTLDLSLDIDSSFFSSTGENALNFSMDMDQFLASVNEGEETEGK